MERFFFFYNFRFAIDYSFPTMIPLNTSVTQTGNDVLSDLDVAKINCAYSCEAYGGRCGGNLKVRDDPVEIARSGPSNCRWSLHAHGVVEDEDHQQYGLQIRIIKVIVGSKLYLAANRKFYQALCLSICQSSMKLFYIRTFYNLPQP